MCRITKRFGALPKAAETCGVHWWRFQRVTPRSTAADDPVSGLDVAIPNRARNPASQRRFQQTATRGQHWEHASYLERCLPEGKKGNPALPLHQVLQLHPDDNVLVALVDLQEGANVSFSGRELNLTAAVPAKHKFAMQD